MSYSVTFYSFSKKANSTKRPAASDVVTTLQCEIKTSSSVFRPVLDVTIASTVNPTSVNYAYIPDFGRYYFIEDWSWNFGAWTVSLVVDPLASFKTQIGASSQYVVRSASSWDGDIQDMLYPVTTERDVVTGVASTIQLDYAASNSGYYVLGVIGKLPSIGAVSYYFMSATQMSNLLAWLLDPQTFDASLDKNILNPFQYIVSCLWFPMNVEGLVFDSPVSSITLGWWTYSVTGQTVAYRFYDATATFTNDMTIPKHPQAPSRGTYLNASPYSRFHLYFKPFGIVTVDSNAIKDQTKLHCVVKIDLINGNAELIAGVNHAAVSGDSNTRWEILVQSTAKIGVNIQLAQVTADYLGGVTALAGAVSSVATSALVGDVAGAISGGISGIGNVLNTIAPSVSMSGQNGGFTNVQNPGYTASGIGGRDYPNALMLISEFFHIVDEDLSSRGRPLCQVKQISTLSGYVLCADVELALACTDAERQEVKTLMEGGFFYE